MATGWKARWLEVLSLISVAASYRLKVFDEPEIIPKSGKDCQNGVFERDILIYRGFVDYENNSTLIRESDYQCVTFNLLERGEYEMNICKVQLGSSCKGYSSQTGQMNQCYCNKETDDTFNVVFNLTASTKWNDRSINVSWVRMANTKFKMPAVYAADTGDKTANLTINGRLQHLSNCRTALKIGKTACFSFCLNSRAPDHISEVSLFGVTYMESEQLCYSMDIKVTQNVTLAPFDISYTYAFKENTCKASKHYTCAIKGVAEILDNFTVNACAIDLRNCQAVVRRGSRAQLRFCVGAQAASYVIYFFFLGANFTHGTGQCLSVHPTFHNDFDLVNIGIEYSSKENSCAHSNKYTCVIRGVTEAYDTFSVNDRGVNLTDCQAVVRRQKLARFRFCVGTRATSYSILFFFLGLSFTRGNKQCFSLNKTINDDFNLTKFVIEYTAIQNGCPKVNKYTCDVTGRDEEVDNFTLNGQELHLNACSASVTRGERVHFRFCVGNPQVANYSTHLYFIGFNLSNSIHQCQSFVKTIDDDSKLTDFIIQYTSGRKSRSYICTIREKINAVAKLVWAFVLFIVSLGIISCVTGFSFTLKRCLRNKDHGPIEHFRDVWPESESVTSIKSTEIS